MLGKHFNSERHNKLSSRPPLPHPIYMNIMCDKISINYTVKLVRDDRIIWMYFQLLDKTADRNLYLSGIWIEFYNYEKFTVNTGNIFIINRIKHQLKLVFFLIGLEIIPADGLHSSWKWMCIHKYLYRIPVGTVSIAYWKSFQLLGFNTSLNWNCILYWMERIPVKAGIISVNWIKVRLNLELHQ